MRIYSRADFMTLPQGTIFAKGKPCYFGGLCVKADTILKDGIGIDFIYLSLESFECRDSGEFVDRFTEMAEKGARYPFDDEAYGRDGMFDKDDLFLVYEPADLAKLAAIVAGAA